MLERRNPLPVGRYWLDVFEPNIPAWSAWSTGKVKVRASEYFAGSDASVFSDKQPARQWVLFEVAKPVAWDAKTFGYPTIVLQSAEDASSGVPINTGVQSSQDTTTNVPGDDSPDVGKLIVVGLAFVALLMFAQSREERQGRARL